MFRKIISLLGVLMLLVTGACAERWILNPWDDMLKDLQTGTITEDVDYTALIRQGGRTFAISPEKVVCLDDDTAIQWAGATETLLGDRYLLNKDGRLLDLDTGTEAGTLTGLDDDWLDMSSCTVAGDYLFNQESAWRTVGDYRSGAVSRGCYQWRTQTMLFPDVMIFATPNYRQVIIDGYIFGTRYTEEDEYESLVIAIDTGQTVLSFPGMRWTLISGSDSARGLAIDMGGTVLMENDEMQAIVDWHTGEVLYTIGSDPDDGRFITRFDSEYWEIRHTESQTCYLNAADGTVYHEMPDPLPEEDESWYPEDGYSDESAILYRFESVYNEEDDSVTATVFRQSTGEIVCAFPNAAWVDETISSREDMQYGTALIRYRNSVDRFAIVDWHQGRVLKFFTCEWDAEQPVYLGSGWWQYTPKHTDYYSCSERKLYPYERPDDPVRTSIEDSLSVTFRRSVDGYYIAGSDNVCHSMCWIIYDPQGKRIAHCEAVSCDFGFQAIDNGDPLAGFSYDVTYDVFDTFVYAPGIDEDTLLYFQHDPITGKTLVYPQETDGVANDFAEFAYLLR